MTDKDTERAEMARSYLPDEPPKVTDRVFNMAWEQGHASGIHEVEMAYADLADLVAIVREN